MLTNGLIYNEDGSIRFVWEEDRDHGNAGGFCIGRDHPDFEIELKNYLLGLSVSSLVSYIEKSNNDPILKEILGGIFQAVSDKSAQIRKEYLENKPKPKPPKKIRIKRINPETGNYDNFKDVIATKEKKHSLFYYDTYTKKNESIEITEYLDEKGETINSQTMNIFRRGRAKQPFISEKLFLIDENGTEIGIIDNFSGNIVDILKNENSPLKTNADEGR